MRTITKGANANDLAAFLWKADPDFGANAWLGHPELYIYVRIGPVLIEDRRRWTLQVANVQRKARIARGAFRRFLAEVDLINRTRGPVRDHNRRIEVVFVENVIAPEFATYLIEELGFIEHIVPDAFLPSFYKFL